MKIRSHKLASTLSIASAMFVGVIVLLIQLSLTQSSFAQEADSTSAESAAATGQLQNATEEKEDDDPLGIRKLPEEAEDIGVDSFTGETLEMEVLFRDTENNSVRFADLFDGKRPVMLSFNYSDCPKLCSVQLENMTLALREVDFKIGEDFQVVSISIDPNEQTSRSRETKEKYTHLYNQPESNDSWHFLTGKRKDIRFIADQCGFRYKYVAKQKLYSHPPVFILVSPQGKIVRYIHGLDYDPNTIRLALIESAEGKIGSPINILSYGLGCFTFNESTGKYTFQAIALMRIGGAVTVLLLLIGLVPYWFLRRGSNNDEEPGQDSTSGLDGNELVGTTG